MEEIMGGNRGERLGTGGEANIKYLQFSFSSLNSVFSVILCSKRILIRI